MRSTSAALPAFRYRRPASARFAAALAVAIGLTVLAVAQSIVDVRADRFPATGQTSGPLLR